MKSRQEPAEPAGDMTGKQAAHLGALGLPNREEEEEQEEQDEDEFHWKDLDGLDEEDDYNEREESSLLLSQQYQPSILIQVYRLALSTCHLL